MIHNIQGEFLEKLRLTQKSQNFNLISIFKIFVLKQMKFQNKMLRIYPFDGRCVSDPPLSDIDIKNKMALVLTTLKVSILSWIFRFFEISTMKQLRAINPRTKLVKDGTLNCSGNILETFLSLSLGFSFNKPSNNSKQSGVARVTTSDNS